MVEPYYDDGRVTLHLGDALELAGRLPDGSVGCIVTSPPYFGLRDYGVDGQIGGEATVDEYVSRLVALFAELRRGLADDGTLWLNLGDSYAGSGSGAQGTTGAMATRSVGEARQKVLRGARGVGQTKQLLMVPARVALALQADGWTLRSDIIWAKPNPMPESVTDRPTKSHEHVFLLAKSERYWYDADAIAEPFTQSSLDRLAQPTFDQQTGGEKDYGTTGVNPNRSMRKTIENLHDSGRTMRNARDVWTIPTTPFAAAHFAVFPAELARRCIRAGAQPGSTVLDPFSGSGTTGKIALLEGHPYIGFDLNREYLDLSLRERFAQQPLDIGSE